MSTTHVKLALRSLITSPVPTVVVLKGKWGRGKTYLWRESLRRYAPQASDRWSRYSYVSLFGVETLAELRDTVLANAEPLADLVAESPNRDRNPANEPSALTRAVVASAEGLKKFFRSTDEAADLARRANAPGLAHAYLLRSLQGYLVCVDDLERRGEHLRMRDVLGYLSSLRDDRRCSVILILNIDELTAADREEFERLREKVFDHEVSFDPSAADCVELVFPKDETEWDTLRANCLTLSIENVRVLQRIRKTFERLAKEVGDGYPAARARLELSVPLLALCYYSRESFHPPFDVVRSATSPQRQAWAAFFKSYGDWTPGPLDDVICDYLERGYVDGTALANARKAL